VGGGARRVVAPADPSARASRALSSHLQGRVAQRRRLSSFASSFAPWPTLADLLDEGGHVELLGPRLERGRDVGHLVRGVPVARGAELRAHLARDREGRGGV